MLQRWQRDLQMMGTVRVAARAPTSSVMKSVNG